MNKINSNSDLHPCKLSAEEINDPHLVIRQFFDFASLPNCREYLWEWLKATVSGTFNTELVEKDQRCDIVCFYEHIEKLVEAAHLISLRQTSNSKKKKRPV